MPSGITADIYEGKDVSLRDYLMTVGRQMSMAMMQRDDDPKEPVKLRKPSSYALDSLEQAILERHRLADLTEAEAKGEAAKEWHAATAAHREAAKENDELKARYKSMIAKVQAWQPEPDVEYVKGHALRYLQESLKFDCAYVYPGDPGDKPKPTDVWLTEKITEVERQITYFTKQWEDEVERVSDFNKHILAFHRSLPDE